MLSTHTQVIRYSNKVVSMCHKESYWGCSHEYIGLTEKYSMSIVWDPQGINLYLFITRYTYCRVCAWPRAAACDALAAWAGVAACAARACRARRARRACRACRAAAAAWGRWRRACWGRARRRRARAWWACCTHNTTHIILCHVFCYYGQYAATVFLHINILTTLKNKTQLHDLY